MANITKADVVRLQKIVNAQIRKNEALTKRLAKLRAKAVADWEKFKKTQKKSSREELPSASAMQARYEAHWKDRDR
jgi:hypothetical protein